MTRQFSRLVAERTELVPDVAPYRPGQFYPRELPPMRAVLDGLSEMALLAGAHRIPGRAPPRRQPRTPWPVTEPRI